MKLYTEEQVNELRRALRDIAQWDEYLEDDWGDPGYRAIDALRCFEKSTPLKLPSDEEIGKYLSMEGHPLSYDNAFIEGAQWYREQIKNQVK